jgi:hypothetical protein
MNRKATLVAAMLLVPAASWAQSPIPIPDIGFPDVPCPAPGGISTRTLSGPFVLALAIAQGETVCRDLSGSIRALDDLGKLYVLGGATGVSVDLGFGTAIVSALFNTDPFITFGATTTNVVAGPVTYAFLYGTPIVPGFYTTATSTAGVSVTNGAGGTAIVSSPGIYPTYVSGYGTLGATATNLGVDLGTAPCIAGPGAPATVTNTCNYGTTVNTFAPTFYDNLEALLTYNQTDVSSVASWSGAVTLNATAVPEPATVTLMVTGLLVIAGVARGTRRMS